MPACMYMYHVCALPERPEEAIWSPEVEVADGWELHVVLGNKIGPVEE